MAATWLSSNYRALMQNIVWPCYAKKANYFDVEAGSQHVLLQNLHNIYIIYTLSINGAFTNVKVISIYFSFFFFTCDLFFSQQFYFACRGNNVFPNILFLTFLSCPCTDFHNRTESDFNAALSGGPRNMLIQHWLSSLSYSIQRFLLLFWIF